MPVRPLIAALTVVPSFAAAAPDTPAASSVVAAVAGAATTSGVTVTVIVNGIAARGGRLGAALFATAVGFPDAPVPLSLLHPHTAASVDTFGFRDVAPGRYAVAVQHDLNANGKLDRSMVGSPKEPWG